MERKKVKKDNVPTVGKERNYGIDLLRILSMLFVVILHVVGQGGIISQSINISNHAAYNAASALQVVAFCAVNCYAAISGYVGVKSKFKYSNIVHLWLSVFFYTGLITLLFGIFYPDLVTKEQIFSAFFPVMKAQYWYFTAYFCLFFISPLLNFAVNKLPKRQMGAIIISLIAILSVAPLIFKLRFFGNPLNDYFWMSNGYSTFWLMAVYLIGAYISKYDCFKKIPTFCFFLAFAASCTISWICLLKVGGGGYFVNYTSPTILLNGICLLIGFSRLKLTSLSKIIGFASPLAFSVYIIHTHPLIWNKFIRNNFVSLASFPVWKLVIFALLGALTIYVVCSLIDLIRHYLFKLLRIKKNLEKLEKKLIGDLWSEEKEN